MAGIERTGAYTVEFQASTTETISVPMAGATLEDSSILITEDTSSGTKFGAYTGSSIWTLYSGSFDNNTFREKDPSDWTVVSQLNSLATDEARDIAWHQSSLWQSSGASLFEIDPANGTILSTLSSPAAPYTGGITGGGGANLFVSSTETGNMLVYEVNTAGTTINTFTISDSLDNLTWDGTFFYGFDSGRATILYYDSSWNFQGYIIPEDQSFFYSSNGWAPYRTLTHINGDSWKGTKANSFSGDKTLSELTMEQTITPSNFQNMNSGDADGRVSISFQEDDTVHLDVRIVDNSSNILAAADSGGTFTRLKSDITFSNTNITPVTFNYINTSATKSQWNNASVELRQVYSTNMSNDSANLHNVKFVLSNGDYTAGATTVNGDAALAAQASIVAAALVTRFGQSTLTASATIPPLELETLGAAVLTAVGTTTVTGLATTFGVASINAIATVTATATTTVIAVVQTILSTGTIVVAGARAQLGTGVMAGTGSVSAGGIANTTGQSALAGAATVVAAVADINNPPNSPSLVAPTDGATIQTSSGHTVDWTHNDADGDPQAAYRLRRRVYR